MNFDQEYKNKILKLIKLYTSNKEHPYNKFILNINNNNQNNKSSNIFSKNITYYNCSLSSHKYLNKNHKKYLINNSFYVDLNKLENELFDNFLNIIKTSKNKKLINYFDNNSKNEENYYDLYNKYYIYNYDFKDNNPYEEIIVYKNNKLEKYFCEDSINNKIWKDNFINNINNINSKFTFDNLNKINENYFDLEFSILNIFNNHDKKNRKFGNYFKTIWKKNYKNKDFSNPVLKYYLNFFMKTLIDIDKYLKKENNYNNINNISKELNVDSEIIYLIGNLNYKYGINEDKSKFAIKQVGIFIKLLTLFLNITNRLIPSKNNNYEIKFNLDDYKVYNLKFKNKTKYINNIYNEFNYESLNNENKKYIDNVALGLKITLFNKYFSFHLNKYFYNFDIDYDDFKFYYINKNDLNNNKFINKYINFYYVGKIFNSIMINKLNLS